MDDAQRRGYAWRVSVFFAAVFLVAGTQLPYLPVWLDWRGLSATEIGIVMAAPLFVRIVVTPLIAHQADRLGDHRGVLIALSWAALAMLLVLSACRSFWTILPAATAFALFWTTVMPLAETIAMRGVRSGGLDYGRMRLWGSLSFIAATFIGGIVVDRLGSVAGIWLVIAGAIATAVAGHALPRPPSAQTAAGEPARAAPRRLAWSEAFGLLRRADFAVFLVAAGVTQAAHAVFYAFGVLHWQKQGITTTWTGALWAIGVLVEVLLFAYSKQAVRSFGSVGLLMAGALAAAFRWLVMGLDPSLGVLIPLQVLHALTFGATHLGAIHYIAEAVDERRHATAQALYAAVTAGIAMGLAMIASGPLYAAFEGRAYFAMAALGFIGVLATGWLVRIGRAGART